MNIEIKELGYVKDVKVDLSKDLIILCGPNNTGKTYVAYAIYGLTKEVSNNNTSIKRIINLLQPLFNKGNIELDLIEILEKSHIQLIDIITKKFVSNIHNVFATSRQAFSETSINIKLTDLDIFKERILAKEISNQLYITRGFSITFVKPKDSTKLQCIYLNENKLNNGPVEIPDSIIMDFLAREIQSFYSDVFFPKSYIAPAERIAINLFSKELSLKRNNLVDQLLELKDSRDKSDPFDLINRRATRYPLPIRDSLELAEDLNNFKKQKSKFIEFANEIESGILKGKVAISKEGEIQFRPQKGKVILPIHISSSAVKSLSSLVVYFRHIATQGDFIIIDEPELNLHPDNQVIIARIIAKIVNKGFKVLINTHSDYIIREINNLIMLSGKKNYLKQLAYSDDEIIYPNQVQALLFHYDKRKVESLKVTETGFEVETIDKITNYLNDVSQSLYFDTFSKDNE